MTDTLALPVILDICHAALSSMPEQIGQTLSRAATQQARQPVGFHSLLLGDSLGMIAEGLTTSTSISCLETLSERQTRELIGRPTQLSQCVEDFALGDLYTMEQLDAVMQWAGERVHRLKAIEVEYRLSDYRNPDDLASLRYYGNYFDVVVAASSVLASIPRDRWQDWFHQVSLLLHSGGALILLESGSKGLYNSRCFKMFLTFLRHYLGDRGNELPRGQHFQFPPEVNFPPPNPASLELPDFWHDHHRTIDPIAAQYDFWNFCRDVGARVAGYYFGDLVRAEKLYPAVGRAIDDLRKFIRTEEVALPPCQHQPILYVLRKA